MIAFEIHRNNRRICVAGIGPNGVLTSILSYARIRGKRELNFEVSGLIGPTEEHLQWSRLRPKIGDLFRVKITNVKTSDEPRSRYFNDPAKDLESKKNYVRHAAKELGWIISERGKQPQLRRTSPL